MKSLILRGLSGTSEYKTKTCPANWKCWEDKDNNYSLKSEYQLKILKRELMLKLKPQIPNLTSITNLVLGKAKKILFQGSLQWIKVITQLRQPNIFNINKLKMKLSKIIKIEALSLWNQAKNHSSQLSKKDRVQLDNLQEKGIHY